MRTSISARFAAFAGKVSKIAGRPYVFIICLAVVLIWAAPTRMKEVDRLTFMVVGGGRGPSRWIRLSDFQFI